MKNNGVLYLENPSGCHVCKLCRKTDSSYRFCNAPGYGFDFDVKDHFSHNTKPDWCPIKVLSDVTFNDGKCDIDLMREPIGYVNTLDLMSCIQNKTEHENLSICIEELSELTKALCKHIRYKTDTTRYDVLEELSDVLLVCGMIKLMLGFVDDEMKNMMEYKNSRNVRRLPREVSVYPVDMSSRVVKEEFKFKTVAEACRELGVHMSTCLAVPGSQIDVCMKLSTLVVFMYKSQMLPSAVIGITSESVIAECTEILSDTEYEHGGESNE